MRGIRMLAPEGIPPIHAGDDLPQILTAALHTVGEIQNGDILVLAHKIISKAEGRVYSLSQVTPSPEALRYAQMTGKDPRILQVVLEESSEVVKARPGVIITRHKLGFICANAAVDHSNAGGEDLVVALPRDPDQSAKRISDGIFSLTGKRVAVVVADTHGRSFREGAIGVCVGCYGIAPIHSYRGATDRDGYVMQSSEEAIADELCSAATLLMGQGDESRPAVLIQGYAYPPSEKGAKEIFRLPERELFT